MKLIENLRLRLFNGAFDSSKCDKTTVLAVDRIRKLRKRKEEGIVKTRNKISTLLQCGQDQLIKLALLVFLIVDLIREENILEAYVLIKGFCNLVRGSLSVIQLSNRNSTDEEIEKIIQQIAKPCNINGEQQAWNCHPTSPYLYDGIAYNAFINYK
ncbi:unnamed protein product [Malus baccata var. baccata]